MQTCIVKDKRRLDQERQAQKRLVSILYLWGVLTAPPLWEWWLHPLKLCNVELGQKVF